MSGRNKFFTLINRIRSNVLITAFILSGLLFACGLCRLFALRIESGDMFPPYSSLRSDPLGSKALFMALERMTGLEVLRNFRDPAKLRGAPGQTIYYLGAGEELLDSAADRQVEELEALAGEGNRLVIAFGATKGRASAVRPVEENDDGENGEDDVEGRPGPKASAESQSCRSRSGRWGIGIGALDPASRPGPARSQAALASGAPGLPPAIPLHSRSWFLANADEWRTVYSFEERPVVLERRIGRGSIVLLADAYLLSNEAMRNDRLPGLLAWLQGTQRGALFDESHLGVLESPGVMTLVRKHSLLPFLIALLALAALYVWKSAVPFVNSPIPEKELREEGLRDNFSGLVNLLQRNIARDDLLETCFREWSRSFARENRDNPALAKRIKAILAGEAACPPGKRDPLGRYREIQGSLKAEGKKSEGC